MINHALAAFTQAQKKKIHLTSHRNMLNSQYAPVSNPRAAALTALLVLIHPEGVCVGCILFPQQQLNLHAGSDTFTATTAVHFRFSMPVFIKAH